MAHPHKLYTFWKILVQSGQEYRKQIKWPKDRVIGDKGYLILDSRQANPLEVPDLVSSRTPEGLHRLAVDVDFPVRVVPSRTAGHFHLYLDGMNPINFHKYATLLRALSAAGIIEHNYAEVSIRRGMTMLRYDTSTLLPTDAGFKREPDPKHDSFIDDILWEEDVRQSQECQEQVMVPMGIRGFVRSLIKRRGIYG